MSGSSNNNLGNGVFKALTFSDFSTSDDIKLVCQKMFSALPTSGVCYRVRMKPTPSGITADAYVYCASSNYGFVHIRDHGGTDYYGRVQNGTWTWNSYALKSDLSAYATNAQLQSTFINISNKRYVKITASENNSNYGIIFAVTSQGILCVYSVNGNFTTLFESTGNRVKISASGLVTTIDCVASYTHGFILRGGSLKNMPYEIS